MEASKRWPNQAFWKKHKTSWGIIGGVGANLLPSHQVLPNETCWQENNPRLTSSGLFGKLRMHQRVNQKRNDWLQCIQRIMSQNKRNFSLVSPAKHGALPSLQPTWKIFAKPTLSTIQALTLPIQKAGAKRRILSKQEFDSKVVVYQ